MELLGGGFHVICTDVALVLRAEVIVGRPEGAIHRIRESVALRMSGSYEYDDRPWP